MKALISAGLVLLGCSIGTGAALAQAQSETIFSHKAWEVQIVGFDDGSISCLAQVSDHADMFSIWSDPYNPVKLQFYSEGWQFDGGTADLEVQIDGRAPWSMTNAELYQNSVLFNLPNDDSGSRFLLEVVNGRTLHLRSAEGQDVQSYSLSGSGASIRALVECVEVLEQGADSNPFN